MNNLIKKCCALLALCILNNNIAFSNSDSVNITVHFLHGSKPHKKYKYEEDRWFGGILGGHVGVEFEPNKILNFVPKARFHVFSHPKIINSKFSIHDTVSFYEILGGQYSSVKKTMITIKISAEQKKKLDSLVNVYYKRSPYDYAFFGMRCGAATYDVLAQIGVVKKHSFNHTWRKIFYPRRVRRILEGNSNSQIYTINKSKGSMKRIWEKD